MAKKKTKLSNTNNKNIFLNSKGYIFIISIINIKYENLKYNLEN